LPRIVCDPADVRIFIIILLIASTSAAAQSPQPDAADCPPAQANQCRIQAAACLKRMNRPGNPQKLRAQVCESGLSICYSICALQDLINSLDTITR
jgi:hypothetical protein